MTATRNETAPENNGTGKSLFEKTVGRRFGKAIPEDNVLCAIPALGESLKVASQKRVPLTKAYAEKILMLADVPGERPVRDAHVAYLCGCMKRGTWRPELVTLVTCKCLEDGRLYRENGQHTCWAVTLMPEGFDAGTVNAIEYEAATLADVRILYSSVDRGTARTKANVIGSYLTGTEQFGGVNSTTIRAVATGLAWWLWDTPNERVKHDGDDVAYLMQTEYKSISSSVAAFLSEPNMVVREGSFLARASVIAAMFATFNKAVKPAMDFWSSVRSGVGMTDALDPRLKLRNALMNSRISLKTKTHTGSGLKQASGEETYRWCVHAWNAWRKGETLSALRANLQSKRPAVK